MLMGRGGQAAVMPSTSTSAKARSIHYTWEEDCIQSQLFRCANTAGSQPSRFCTLNARACAANRASRLPSSVLTAAQAPAAGSSAAAVLLSELQARCGRPALGMRLLPGVRTKTLRVTPRTPPPPLRASSTAARSWPARRLLRAMSARSRSPPGCATRRTGARPPRWARRARGTRAPAAASAPAGWRTYLHTCVSAPLRVQARQRVRAGARRCVPAAHRFGRCSRTIACCGRS